MASWLPETLFEIVGQGPAPCKDYYQLLVTRSQVIFRWWKVSLRSEYRSSKPGETKESHEDFLENSHLQGAGEGEAGQTWGEVQSPWGRSVGPSTLVVSEAWKVNVIIISRSTCAVTEVQIALIFGGRILDYVLNLCEGRFDFLERLSDSLLLNIISYLDLEDLTNLSQTSRRFSKLCRSDQLWELIVRSACDNLTPDLRALAEEMGWRQMFFTNKLQLQRQIRKRRQRQESQGGSGL
ncbi:F-box only protein 36 isoform X1 [Artibeus jamaicensis]|uniref:F-box only protein 36 isoform X1 n=1 Tax=Artibeus jamaicensis TaxID=9417 RepID=UPI00235A5018|nr:F-box only protein 36 isoform X1 [Artibeus jamaicensis]